MTTDLEQLAVLAAEISHARARLQEKQNLLEQLLREVPQEQAIFNQMLARHGQLKQQLVAPTPSTQPTFFDTPPATMGTRTQGGPDAR